MGMFDTLRCDYPLPARAQVQDLSFQTKSLDCLMLNYQVRADGTLWVEDFDIEDRSDPNAEGLARLAGMMTPTNQRWRHMDDFTGEVVFYGDYGPRNASGWGEGQVEFSAYFTAGTLTAVNLVSETVPASVIAEDQAQALDEKTPDLFPSAPRARL